MLYKGTYGNNQKQVPVIPYKKDIGKSQNYYLPFILCNSLVYTIICYSAWKTIHTDFYIFASHTKRT